MKNIVFASVPYTDTQSPLMAPAVLKSIATKAGWSSNTHDLNIKVVRLIEQSRYANQLINFFHHGKSTPEIEQTLYDLFLSHAELLLKSSPDVIGLSIFTYNCQISTKYLCFLIKKISPNTKILLGGAGLSNNLALKSKFAEELLKHQLIDFYIRGDGENSLYDYLISQITSTDQPIKNDWQQLSNDDLSRLPVPNYDDYDFSDYRDSATIPILGSRGCVRNCNFCDIHVHWTKFSWRSGEHIFAEMMELHQKYGSCKFMFNDSLINGNLKEYRVLMKLIADYNQVCNPDKKFYWTSLFILRPVQNFTEKDWQLTAAAGGHNLFVGVETFNDKSRFHLGKKFTNEDIEFSIQMAVKYGITFVLLFFIGYITETEDDVDFAINWYKDHVKYKDNLIINLGTPLGILEGTPLMQQFDQLGLVRTGPNDQDWTNPATGNTPAKRVEWFHRLNNTVIELGYRQVGGLDNRFILEKMIQNI